MAKFVSITASHEHGVRSKDGCELRQAIGLALVILLPQGNAIYLTKSTFYSVRNTLPLSCRL